MSGGAISWCSEKQDYIALSTMEVKYIARCIATQEAIWLRHFLQNLNLITKVDDPIVLLYDNTIAIQFTLCKT